MKIIIMSFKTKHICGREKRLATSFLQPGALSEKGKTVAHRWPQVVGMDLEKSWWKVIKQSIPGAGQQHQGCAGGRQQRGQQHLLYHVKKVRGEKSLTVKGADNKYHVEGKLSVVNKEEVWGALCRYCAGVKCWGHVPEDNTQPLVLLWQPQLSHRLQRLHLSRGAGELCLLDQRMYPGFCLHETH